MFYKNFIKVACISPKVKLGNPLDNVNEIINCLNDAKDTSIACLPEMAITGYSINDLIFQEYMYQDNLNAIKYLLDNNPYDGVILVGSYIKVNDVIYNVCFVIQKDKILGLVPKRYIPKTYEFYEERYFESGANANFKEVEILGQAVPFGKLLFTTSLGVKFGVEVCEDYWAPDSPNEELYTVGAQIVFNVSSSPEYASKEKARKLIAAAASYKGNGAYIYVSTNASESSSECIFSSVILAYENGELLKEDANLSIESKVVKVDLDLGKLNHIRNTKGWKRYLDIDDSKYIKVNFDLKEDKDFKFEEKINVSPFLPREGSLESLDNYSFKHIADLQAVSLINRLNYIGIKKCVLGVSGGLDSTLALLTIAYCYDKYGIDHKNIIAVTLPSSNTSDTTYTNAIKLMEKLGVDLREINIHDDVVRQEELIGHDKAKKDTTYENIQARFRTYTLMNIANMEGGIVVGTSDMSEVALGWSTFNGDQMAMYGLNAGLPKTVVREMVRFSIDIYPNLKECLLSVIGTPISPELAGSNQLTEDIIGKYEINDFILYHFLVNGDEAARIMFLIQKGFGLSEEDAFSYVDNFQKRFFSQQYKRITMPEGVKLLNICMSPRSDLRIAGDIRKPNNK